MRIALVTDFFYPYVGGVESHVYHLGLELVARGHKIVIITHAHKPHRIGVRYLPQGLKVYYIPLALIPPSSLHATLPNFFLALPLLRYIIIREQINVVHSHAALSSLALESLLHARSLGLSATVFTDHSLLAFGGPGEIWANKMLKASLSDVDASIAVSHTARDNAVLRAALPPHLVHVVPNALVPHRFIPRPELAGNVVANKGEPVTIVVVSRLVYRKGIDLLVAALPILFKRFDNLKIIIAGGGPKLVNLQQLSTIYPDLFTPHRFQLLGSVPHSAVVDILNRGHIFLNTSLTEAFGIGLIEAAAAGLLVVSTRVGGVPEVLPPEFLRLAEPQVDDLVEACSEAVTTIANGKHDPYLAHERIREAYSWQDIARRTENVYRQAISTPQLSILDRLRKHYRSGPVLGKIMCIIVCVDIIFLAILSYIWPAKTIDLCPDWDTEAYNRAKKSQQ